MINNNWRAIKYHKTALYTNIYQTRMLLFITFDNTTIVIYHITYIVTFNIYIM